MNRWIFLASCFIGVLGAHLNGDIALQATSTISSNWNTGYVTEITVTNPSASATSGWAVNFALQPGQIVDCSWNGAYTQSSQNVIVSNPPGNGTIQPGQSITLGFQAANPGMTSATLTSLVATGNPSTSPPGSSLTAAYHIDTVWATAYQATVTLTNTTNAPTSAWTATFGLPQGFTLSDHVTNGSFMVSGQNVTVQNLAGAGVISSGGTATFSMIIDMPASGTPAINNLQAFANGSPPPPPPPPASAPVLQAISNPSGANQYSISWTSVTNATGYTLQSSTNSSFTNPVTVFSGDATSFAVTGQAVGTYYYEVMATAGSSVSAPSNVESVTVTQTPPPPLAGYENSTWAEDWTNDLDASTYIQALPLGINTINVFVGQLDLDSSGNPLIDGYSEDTPGRPAGTGAFPTVAALTDFITQCKAQGVSVKLSIGGASGTNFGNSWNNLTSSNVSAYAQALVNFCQTTGANGIDFDDEFEVNANATLAGMLAAEFKKLAPNLQTSFCVFAGISTAGPTHEVDSIFLQNAVTASGTSAIDRVYVMCYYDGVALAENEQFMLLWKTWLQQNYSIAPLQISAGLDPNDPNTSPSNGSLTTWVNFAAQNGFSTAIWDQLGVNDYITNKWGEVVKNIYTGQ